MRLLVWSLAVYPIGLIGCLSWFILTGIDPLPDHDGIRWVCLILLGLFSAVGITFMKLSKK